jgi:hypothetical protein
MELAWLRLANEEIAIAIVVDKDMRLGPFSGGGGLGERSLELLHVLLGFRKQVSAPAANVYLRRHVEVPVDVPRIVLVLRCPRRQILRPWLPMPDRCFKASLIDRVTLLCVDSGADRTVGKDCNRDSRGENGGTRHAQWILHRALETRSAHSKTPILSHHCQGCIRTKNNMAARWMPVAPELLDLVRGGDEGRARKSAVEQCVPVPTKGRHRHTTSGLRLFKSSSQDRSR